jgi:hypothetical protein
MFQAAELDKYQLNFPVLMIVGNTDLNIMRAVYLIRAVLLVKESSIN